MHDGDTRATVAQPVLERFRPEQYRQRQGNRAELVNGEMGNNGFDGLRQHDGDAVAPLDTAGAQCVGELIGVFFQLAEGITGALSG